jgi:hypothetical protein
MGLTQAEAQRLLDAHNGTAAYTPPSGAKKVALTTTVGTATAAGSEVVGGSYGRQTITESAAAAATPATSSNSGTLTWAGMPAVTVDGVDEYDSGGTPFRSATAPLTSSKTTNAGDTFSIATGSYDKSMGG